ncbi:MAG TPA: VIT1/CCC1 transporter family protein [Mycobacterium sp.]|nr:VIT1/CCC1 transporter family protein [Mycobacterium sp.]
MAVSVPKQEFPHDFDHSHGDVSGGWLRAATFGAMDGLVTNTALIAGVGAVADEHAVLLSGVAGLVAGAFSMALGEYTSVTTANEQIEAEAKVERAAIKEHPEAEKNELAHMLMKRGLSEATAREAVEEIHANEDAAVRVHLAQEIGIDPDDTPSPLVAAGSSFLMFSIGAIIPLIPYLLGFGSLLAGLVCGGVGLLIAGALAAYFTKQPAWRGALRQLLFGGIAVGATYLVGDLIGAML